MTTPTIARLHIRQVAGVDHPANKGQLGGAEGWAVMKADGTPGGAPMTTPTLAKPEDVAKAVEALPDDVKAALQKQADDLTAANAKVDELSKAAPAPANDDTVTVAGVPVAKAEFEALPESVRLALTKQDEALAAVTKKADDTAEALAKAAEERDTAAWVTKAEALENAGVDASVLGARLYAMSLIDPNAADELLAQFKAVDAQLHEAGIYAEIGRNATGGENSAHAQIMAKAVELRKDDASLTEAQALVKARRLNPELKAQEKKELAKR